MTRLAACRYRKGSKFIQGTAPKFDGFAIGHRIALYNFLYIDARLHRLTLIGIAPVHRRLKQPGVDDDRSFRRGGVQTHNRRSHPLQ